MTEFVHNLIDQFGLAAIFIGCLLEGETAAILGGFFAHQDVLVPWQVFLTVYVGAFSGDALLFMIGKHFSTSRLVRRFEQNRAFVYAHQMVRKYPSVYVLLNRYVCGMRTIGGVVAGLAGIRTAKFLLLNAMATLIWASIFTSLGYVLGTAAEQIVGAELAKHQRLLLALGIGALVVLAGLTFMHRARRKANFGEVQP